MENHLPIVITLDHSVFCLALLSNRVSIILKNNIFRTSLFASEKLETEMANPRKQNHSVPESGVKRKKQNITPNKKSKRGVDYVFLKQLLSPGLVGTHHWTEWGGYKQVEIKHRHGDKDIEQRRVVSRNQRQHLYNTRSIARCQEDAQPNVATHTRQTQTDRGIGVRSNLFSRISPLVKYPDILGIA